MNPKVKMLDHLVLTVRDLAKTAQFYENLGMSLENFQVADGTSRFALKFGCQKINLHLAGAEFAPNAKSAMPGSADLCFLSDQDLRNWVEHLKEVGIPIEEGPVSRTGANGPIQSIYVRDPDGNLIEIANQL